MPVEFPRYIFKIVEQGVMSRSVACLRYFLSRVADPQHINANPDPDPAFPLMRSRIRILIQNSSLMLIRIQLLYKVMEICDDCMVYRPSRAPF
jgi:hypothetical protein